MPVTLLDGRGKRKAQITTNQGVPSSADLAPLLESDLHGHGRLVRDLTLDMDRAESVEGVDLYFFAQSKGQFGVSRWNELPHDDERLQPAHSSYTASSRVES